MGNLLTNGLFDSSMTGWTTGSGDAAWTGAMGKPHPGCVLLGSTDESNIYQEVAVTSGHYLLTYWLRTLSIPDNEQQSAEVKVEAGTAQLHTQYIYTANNVWYLFAHNIPAPTGTLKITLKVKQTGFAYFDTVGLTLVTGGEFYPLLQRLRNLRRDPVAIKHSDYAYESAINRAIQDAPMSFWQPQVDVSVSTVADQRRYALSLTGLTQPNQVRRVWMDDVSDYDLPLGRWQVEDDGGVLTLVLDSDPPEAGRVLSIEYLAPGSLLVYPWDSTTLDVEWLLARAMTLLLLDADPQIEDPNLLGQQLTYWDALRQNRERELVNQTPRPSQTFRSTPWGNYVK